MELRLAVFFGFCCFASLQAVEGSGVFNSDRKKTTAAEIEYTGGSGFPVDDEDGDVEEGSGSPSDEIEGSGGYPHKNFSVVTPLIHVPTTTYPLDVVKDLERRPIEEFDHHIDQDSIEELHVPDGTPAVPNILIEDSSTVRTTPVLISSPPPVTSRTLPPPVVPEDDHRTRLGALFKPGILAAVIGGFVVGILAAILLVMFIVYRMRKKDEGSYALDEQKQPALYPNYTYQKAPTKEFYA